MEPVIGLDMPKGSSVMQAFVNRNEALGKAETLLHGKQGFERLGERLTELRERTGQEPVVILEATGHYHRGVTSFLSRNGYRHFILTSVTIKAGKRDATVEGEDGCGGCVALGGHVLPGAPNTGRILRGASTCHPAA
ncbi:IS110 family transposase [Brevibacillus agri]|uniref:IS110 family transposase n=1 Tax=Brevibacillus agri TaxID=51101 RepID=UPI00399C64CF